MTPIYNEHDLENKWNHFYRGFLCRFLNKFSRNGHTPSCGSVASDTSTLLVLTIPMDYKLILQDAEYISYRVSPFRNIYGTLISLEGFSSKDSILLYTILHQALFFFTFVRPIIFKNAPPAINNNALQGDG